MDKAQSASCHRGSRLLAPVYSWFTEGFDTADPKQDWATAYGLLSSTMIEAGSRKAA